MKTKIKQQIEHTCDRCMGTEERPNKNKSTVKVHGGVEGGRSHGEDRCRRSQMYTQTTVSMQFQGGVTGGRSHSGNLKDVTRGTNSCGEASLDGDTDRANETWSQGDT